MSGRGHKTPSPLARPRVPEREPESEVHGVAAAGQGDLAAAFLSLVPRIVLSRAELNASDLDHREYFLLSMMDGATTVETILDICGMPSEEALGLLESLERRGIICVEPAGAPAR